MRVHRDHGAPGGKRLQVGREVEPVVLARDYAGQGIARNRIEDQSDLAPLHPGSPEEPPAVHIRALRDRLSEPMVAEAPPQPIRIAVRWTSPRVTAALHRSDRNG